ncbi:hypothetical protein Mapa_003222 [Marchantia paleacea]|nr:hypothetical protein Mapa_003222 [Marchantia paleacea]
MSRACNHNRSGDSNSERVIAKMPESFDTIRRGIATTKAFPSATTAKPCRARGPETELDRK